MALEDSVLVVMSLAGLGMTVAFVVFINFFEGIKEKVKRRMEIQQA